MLKQVQHDFLGGFSMTFGAFQHDFWGRFSMTFGGVQHDNLERLVVLDSSPSAQSDGEERCPGLFAVLFTIAWFPLGLQRFLILLEGFKIKKPHFCEAFVR